MTFTLGRLTMRNSEGCVFSDGRSVRDLERFISWSNIISMSCKNPCGSCSCTSNSYRFETISIVSHCTKQPTIFCLTLLLCVCQANRSTNQSTRRSPSLALSSVCLFPPPPAPLHCASQSAFGRRIDCTFRGSATTDFFTS